MINSLSLYSRKNCQMDTGNVLSTAIYIIVPLFSQFVHTTAASLSLTPVYLFSCLSIAHPKPQP